LDLLKKGNSPIATNARAASRYLEQQVGTNDRLSVQGDTATVNWPPTSNAQDVPQWVQRTICCALWEKAHNADQVAVAIVADSNPPGEMTRWDSRIQGHLVHHWAAFFEIPILEVSKSANRIRQETKPQPRASVEQRQHHNRRNRYPQTPSHGPLVEKQRATVLPSSGVRLLARGEMLAP
jgi:hypothetical protein